MTNARSVWLVFSASETQKQKSVRSLHATKTGGRLAGAFGFGGARERRRPRAAIFVERELLPRGVEAVLRRYLHGGIA